MEVRLGRGAGFRRVARSRFGYVALALVVYALGAAATTWPALVHAWSSFLSGGASGHGEASPGDHLQTLYHWWLVGHQLEHGHAPWLDPYSFRPEASVQPNFPGWPYGFVFWPLDAVLGAVRAWNAAQLLLYVGAGAAACAWLRELGVRRGAALAGGLAFAIAPYRAQQSVGHLLGPISILLAVTLWCVERARRGSAWWLAGAAAALTSIPLSGQVHLALGAVPFFVLYAALRLPRSRWAVVGAGASVVAAAAAGFLVRQTVIAHSTQAGGRSLDQVRFYSAHWGDFVARNVDHARSEQFVYLGWATPLLALVGLGGLVAGRRLGLAVVLGLGALVPILLALGTHLPLYSALWHALPPFRFPRVPERLLPIACLCIAALVAVAVSRARSNVVALLAIALLFVDLHARVYGKSAPGARAAVSHAPARMLELPVFDPGIHYGSVYLWYDTAAQVERPGGYSTTAPKVAKATARRLERLNCGDWSGNTAGLLDRLGIRTIAVHGGLFTRNSAVPNRLVFALRGLAAHGWSQVGGAAPVRVFARRGSSALARVTSRRDRPVFCQGWYGNTGTGWPMSETHAPFWIYGTGRVTLDFAKSPLPRTFTVDERPQTGPTLTLGQEGWHVVTVNVPHLATDRTHGRAGLTLEAIRRTPRQPP